MRTFKLRGLAEGIVGKSTMEAASVEDIFEKNPALRSVRHKLTVDGDTIFGFAACDG